MLDIQKVDALYGDIQALWNVSLQVTEGELVALVGPNGAGKTTTLRVITGLLKPASGSVIFAGQDLKKEQPHKIVEQGISLVPEGGRVFTRMSVMENLDLGSFTPKARKDRANTLKKVFEIFPRLAERKNQRAGTLSGGERQMLAIGRALLARPRLLMLDEPSLGLAPLIVAEVFRLIATLKEQGSTILLVEQNARKALAVADTAYVLEGGRITRSGPAATLRDDPGIVAAYLGHRA
jgi:branched-chain amino acid transport system ATP-binding protein